eukprot:GFUD01026841.1.p1 GENE.GFUD01026841.1~~GFUD01026841.1.p1  ORF type:complete len:501 (+),score=103.73 GFUD01026841.1:277-1779(+)
MSGQTLTETLASKRSALRERLDTIHRRVQYEPWFIKVSTLDRRLLLAIGCIPVLFLILIIALIGVAAGSGGDCQNMSKRGADYRGSESRTKSGLECLAWTTLDRTLHTVTVDRYPDTGLGEHNYCRNPDGSKQVWCYTSLTKDAFDYCDLPACGSGNPVAQTLAGRFRANTDWACQPTVTVVHSVRADGLYLMTDQWANGRGVYARQYNDINTLCISWHGLYRHWWLGPCSLSGANGGVGWLEEDGRCPYDGRIWRAGGTDRLMKGTLVTTNSCLEFETEYNGTLVTQSGQNVLRTDTAIGCQTLCQQTETCVAFTWYERRNCTLLSQVTDRRHKVKFTVSGKPSCKEKVKVGCPSDHIKTNSNICIKFLDQTCDQGCSRYAAMEECEQRGGFLADSLEENDIKNILQLAGNSYNHSFWWVGASDMRKRGGKFSWERSDLLVSDMADLWRNTSTHVGVGRQGNNTLHECVFITHAGGGMRLDHQNCQETIARPLCQFLPS